jgi:hypothetical protein
VPNSVERVRRNAAGGRRRIVPKCAKLGNYWDNFDEINSGYTLYQMIDKYHKRKTNTLIKTMFF